MAEVHPIYNYEDVKAVRRILTKWNNLREAEAFFIACHVGLRASDLLKLKFSDFEGNRVTLEEQKTGKRKCFPISENVSDSVEILRKWYASKGIEPTYLFQATGNRVGSQIKSISQSYYYTKINEACESLGIDGNFGTHTARKTFGYHLYKKTGDVSLLQKIFQHSTQRQTLQYIGVTRKTIDDLYMSVDFS